MNEPLEHRRLCMIRPLRRIRGSLIVVAVAAAVALLAGSAEACPVCFQAKNDASRVAFIVTTGFMTGLPLLLVGGVVWWLRRQFQKAGGPELACPRQQAGSPSRDVARPGRVAASI